MMWSLSFQRRTLRRVGSQAGTTRRMQRRAHLFGTVSVPADQDVDVVRHDRAGVAGVATLVDHLPECGCNLGPGGLVEGQQRKAEEWGCPPVELPHLTS